MSRFYSVCCLCLLAILLTAIANPLAADDELLLGVHPYKSAKSLQKAFSPLASVLGEALGTPVRIVIAADYQEHIQHVGTGKLDIAYLGPVSYVQMVDAFGPPPILARLEINGRPTFQGHIISRADGKIKTIKDIKGKRFAFGNPASTMSHLVPRHMLWRAGISSDDLEKFSFLGNHVNVALAVLSENYDAGAVKEAIYHKYKSRGLRSVAETPSLSEHLFVARGNMPKNKVKKIRDIMLNVHAQPNGMTALQSIKKTMTRLTPAQDNDYDNLRQVLRELEAQGVK